MGAKADYEALVANMIRRDEVSVGQMFGKPCLKAAGKAFASRHNEDVAFKLPAPHHATAMALPGARPWDPSGKRRPMKEWVAVPADQSRHFRDLGLAALEYALGAPPPRAR